MTPRERGSPTDDSLELFYSLFYDLDRAAARGRPSSNGEFDPGSG